MKPLISVIIPVYNTAKYLEKCFNSIINQTYTNLEIIIVDDGSTDNSLEICYVFEKNDIRIKVVHKENEGQGVARNIALDICKGDYISFIDSDDYIDLKMYEILMEEILINNADLAICNICFYNGIRYFESNKGATKQVLKNIDLIKAYVSTPLINTGPCNKIYHKKLFEKIRFPKIKAREDVYIMHEILGLSNLAVYIPRPLYIQNIRSGSTEQSGFNINKLNILEATLRLQEYVLKNFKDFYNFVEYKYLEQILLNMKEIINTFSYRKNKRIYEELEEKLKIELGKFEENAKTSKFDSAIKKKKQFFFTNRLIGLKFKIKKAIKKMVTSIRKIIK